MLENLIKYVVVGDVTVCHDGLFFSSAVMVHSAIGEVED
jgi:hypothetical protein